MKKNGDAELLVNPGKLFIFAQAFHFSSGRGQCFSPGIRSLCTWYIRRARYFLLDRSAAKWWRVWLEKE